MLAGNVPLILSSVLAVVLLIILVPKGSPPAIAVDKTYFEFKAADYGQSYSEKLVITNKGEQVLTGTVASNTKWLSISPDKISLGKGSQEYTVTADTRILKSGFAGKGNIIITSNAGNRTLDVFLSIKE